MGASREAYLTVTEYRKRIESDTKNFFRNDPELAMARPVPHPSKPNKIIFSAGAMASFFPLLSGGKKIAVKLFFQKIPDLAVRYEEIEATLGSIASPAFIKFDYREGPREGAVWGTEFTPYLKMECVEGAVLREEVVDLADKHDGRGLLGLAQQWQEIALMMEAKQIAHGDIQAENLMVERGSGRIRLIDLDTMFVPSLRPKRLKCVAFGIPAWQHPRKETDESYFDERLDRFPALAMYLCLLALSDDPGLVQVQRNGDAQAKLKTVCGDFVGDNEILLTRKDLRDPHRSGMLQRLSGSANPQIRQATEALVKATLGAYDDVPAFSKVADPDVDAKEALKEVEQALRTGDHRRVCEAWRSMLDAYGPAQGVKAEFQMARKHLDKLERFCSAARSDDDKAMAEIWLAAPSLEQCTCSKTEKVEGGVTVADRGAQAVKRIKGIEAVQRAVEAAEQVKRTTGFYGGAEELGVVDAWNDKSYDLGDSQTAKGAWWGRVEESWNRLMAFKDFESILSTEEDEKIAKAWVTVTEFAPAMLHQKRVADATERMKVLGEFVTRLRQDGNDDAGLWRIWQSRPDMALCKSAAKPVAQLGGLIPAQRAALAGRRVEALSELKEISDLHDRLPLQEAGEKVLIAAWRQREAILGSSPAGAPFRKRSEEARRRLQTWELLLKAITEDDDEGIASAWQTGLLASLAGAENYAARAKDATDRMGVIGALAQRIKLDADDEAGLVEIVSGRKDMEKCRGFVKAQGMLQGMSWRERIEVAKEILQVRAAVTRVLSAVPLQYEQLPGVWKESLCRKHRLFAADLGRIDDALELGRHLCELRRGLEEGDIAAVSTSWREEFRELVKEQDLEKVRVAMHQYSTARNCVENLELTLAGGTLTARWDWKKGGNFCFLGVKDGSYPEVPSCGRPNAFRGEATGGLVTATFNGNTPYVRLWAMFRFLDVFFIGSEPLERRFATVEYSVSKPLFRRHKLTLNSLSGEVELPALAVVVSENPVWPSTEEAQRIPGMLLREAQTIELMLPPTVRKREELYVSLRPVEKQHEEWLRLRPAGSQAVVIQL